MHGYRDATRRPNHVRTIATQPQQGGGRSDDTRETPALSAPATKHAKHADVVAAVEQPGGGTTNELRGSRKKKGKKMMKKKMQKSRGGMRPLTAAEMQVLCDRYKDHRKAMADKRAAARDTKRRAAQERRAMYPQLRVRGWRALQVRRLDREFKCTMSNLRQMLILS